MSSVFVSYVEEDGAVARQLSEGLESAGYRTWLYERDTVPGLPYPTQVTTAIEASQSVVVVVSPRSLGSQQVTSELAFAHETDKPILPVLCDVSHEEYQRRRPDWRIFLGAATSVRIPAEGAVAIVPMVASGLAALGARAGDGDPVVSTKGREPSVPATPGHRLARRRWLYAAGAVALIAVIVAGYLGVRMVRGPEPPLLGIVQVLPRPSDDQQVLSFDVLVKNTSDERILLSDAILTVNEDALLLRSGGASLRTVDGTFTIDVGSAIPVAGRSQDASESKAVLTTPEGNTYEVAAKAQGTKNLTIEAPLVEEIPANSTKMIRIVVIWSTDTFTRSDLRTLSLVLMSDTNEVARSDMIGL